MNYLINKHIIVIKTCVVDSMERFKKLRIQKGLTQKDLASMAGVSKNTINLIEQGRRDPKYSTIKKISKALNVRIEFIESI